MRERERSRERGSVHPSEEINTGNSPANNPVSSKEEEDLVERNTKKPFMDIEMEELGDNGMEKEGANRARNVEQGVPEKSAEELNNHQNKEGNQRTQISYKSKLMGKEKMVEVDQDFENQMKEWLKEEEEMAPVLSEDQLQMFERLPRLEISDERLKALCEPWRKSLIITLLGKFVSRDMMRDRLQWMLKAKNFELIDLPNNFFSFRTTDMELSRRLLFDGPWVIQGHYLGVQRWSPNFNPYCNEVRKVAIWVRIPTLPLHIYSEECIWDLGNLIGKALKVDLNTLAHCPNSTTKVERGKFARVSVEVDLNKPLQSRFVLRKRIYHVEYEGLEVICFKCGRYGHNKERCHQDKEKTVAEAEAPKENPLPETPEKNEDLAGKNAIFGTPGTEKDGDYGEWMQAKKPIKRKQTRSNPVQSQKEIHGEGKNTHVTAQKNNTATRFDVLQEIDHCMEQRGSASDAQEKGKGRVWRKKEEAPYVPGKARMEEVFNQGVKGGASDKNGKKEEAFNQGIRGGAPDKDRKKEEAPNGPDKASMEEAINQGIIGGVSEDNGLSKAKTKIRKERLGNGANQEEINLGEVQIQNGGTQDKEKTGQSPIKKKTDGERLIQVGRKRAQTSRPKVVSPLLKKKLASRVHQLAIGCTLESTDSEGKHESSKAQLFKEAQVSYQATARAVTLMQEHEPSALTPEEQKIMTEQSFNSSKEPPDPSTLTKVINSVQDSMEMMDQWFETHDAVEEEMSNDAGVLAESDVL